MQRSTHPDLDICQLYRDSNLRGWPKTTYKEDYCLYARSLIEIFTQQHRKFFTMLLLVVLLLPAIIEAVHRPSMKNKIMCNLSLSHSFFRSFLIQLSTMFLLCCIHRSRSVGADPTVCNGRKWLWCRRRSMFGTVSTRWGTVSSLFVTFKLAWVFTNGSIGNAVR